MFNFLQILLDGGTDAASTPKSGGWWIYIVLIVLVIIMLVVPAFTNRKRMKEYTQMVDRLRVGDEVRTIGGIIGRVTRINKKGETATFIMETGSKGNRTTMEFDMNAVGTVLTSTYQEEEKEKETEAKDNKEESAVSETSENEAEKTESVELKQEETQTQNEKETEKEDNISDIEKRVSGKKPKNKKK